MVKCSAAAESTCSAVTATSYPPDRRSGLPEGSVSRRPATWDESRSHKGGSPLVSVKRTPDYAANSGISGLMPLRVRHTPICFTAKKIAVSSLKLSLNSLD